MIKVKKVVKCTLLSFVVLTLILLSSGFIYITYQKNQVRNMFSITTASGIEEMEKIKLGNTEQWISIRSHDTANPLLLYLHGGPGGSALPVMRHYNCELEQNFTVVNWDQRGTGKSYSKFVFNDAFHINQFVADIHELTEYLINRFETEKIYLLGHSWGSIIGMIAVSERPELYESYIGVAQVVNTVAAEKISYQYTLESARYAEDTEAIEELEAIGPAPYPLDDQFWHKIKTQRKWLSHYGGAVFGDKNLVTITMNLFAPEYTIKDFYNLPRANRRSVEYLWQEMSTINMNEKTLSVDTPVYFLVGRHDYIAPPELVKDYFIHLQAPQKELIWFEESAHSPHLEEPEKFQKIINERILHRNNREERK